MRNLKRVLALAMALVMTLGMMVIGANAASYTDAAQIDDNYAEAIEVLTGMGVFQGQGEGNFAPTATLTRAEASALIYRVLTADVTDAKKDLYDYSSFKDVPEGKWYTGYITYAANGGYVKGYGNDKFGPEDKVTGVQVLAIMLRAMGYGQNGEFEGAGWKDNVLTKATDLGLLKNVKTNDLDKPAERQLVAQLLFDAIQAPTTTYTPALGYLLNDGPSLGVTKFNLVKGDRTEIDNWGRPGYYWTYKTGDKSTCIEEEALATYTAKVSECQIYADAFSTVKAGKVTGLIGWVNGTKLVPTYTVESTDVYTKLGAQGRLTEVYEDRIVMIDTMLAQVTGVTEAKYDAAGHQTAKATMTLQVFDKDTATTNSITLESKTNWTYTKGAMVLGYFETTGTATGYGTNDLFGGHGKAVVTDAEILGVAESFTGSQTVIHYNDGQHTIDGTTYLDANCYHLNQAGISTAKYTWFKDLYGNVIGSAVIPTTYTYGVIKNIQWFTQAGVYGYAQATLTLMDGTEVSKQVSAIATETDYTGTGTAADPYVLKTGTDISLKYASLGTTVDLETGYVSTEIAYNYSKFSGTDLYRIADNGNGTVTLVNVKNPVVGGTEQADVSVTTGAHLMGSVMVDSNTQYLVRNVSALTTPAVDATAYSTYSPVTGFNNIGNFTNAKVDSVDLDKDGRADYVYIIGVSATAKTAGLFYRSSTSNSYYVPVTGTESDYYVLNGYFNGVAGTIKTKNASVKDTIITAAADTLFDVQIENGYVIAATAVPVANTALNAITGYRGPYTGMTGSSYKATGATYSLYYSGDALTVNGITGWNVTEATRVVGTLEEGVTYSSANYTFHIVWSTDALGNMTATEVYVFAKTPGADGADPSSPATTGNILREVKVYQGGNLIGTRTYLQTGIDAATYTTGQDYATVSAALPSLVVTGATLVTDVNTVTVVAGTTVTATYVVALP